jgi:hypothetical protein
MWILMTRNGIIFNMYYIDGGVRNLVHHIQSNGNCPGFVKFHKSKLT